MGILQNGHASDKLGIDLGQVFCCAGLNWFFVSLKKRYMPTISMFFGIIIRMYYAPKEHNPPHVHAYYQNFIITIRIQDCEILEGQIPARQLRLILAWVEIHRDELMANWELCQNGEKPFQIEPLK